MQTPTEIFTNNLELLKKAIAKKDKKGILNCYKEASDIDLETIPESLCIEYADLMTQGNKILTFKKSK